MPKKLKIKQSRPINIGGDGTRPPKPFVKMKTMLVTPKKK